MIPCALSDHSLVFCVFKAGVTTALPRIIEYRSYKCYNKESFLQDLGKNNWSAVVDDNDINATVDNWCKCFTDRQCMLRKMPKLTNEHVYLTSYSKMHVNLATQVLSETVSKVMMAYPP